MKQPTAAKELTILGAIAGDIIGSIYEGRTSRIKTTSFPLFSPHCRFTDDTVLAAATADTLLNSLDYAAVYRACGRRYPMLATLVHLCNDLYLHFISISPSDVPRY